MSCGCGCGGSSPAVFTGPEPFYGPSAGPIGLSGILPAADVQPITAAGPRVDLGIEASWSAILLLVLLIAGGVVVYRWAEEA